MKKIQVMVHGLGNIGKKVIEALETAPDMECCGVIRRAQSVGTGLADLRGVKDFSGLPSLLEATGTPPDVAIVCGPSRQVPVDAAAYLAAGIHTVDSFDIHSEVPSLVQALDAHARTAGKTSISGAGWDPGTDSMLRAIFEAMTPHGTTFTNFGRGRSMGHSVAARAIPGVKNAVSITIPVGGGRHSRLVYLLAEEGADQNTIRENLAKDPYFCHDPLDVRFTATEEELMLVADNSHGVQMERVGASGMTSNQHLCFDMRIDNPALTAQVLVSSARAATRMSCGAYTLIDVPPVMFLPGDRMSHIARLV